MAEHQLQAVSQASGVPVIARGLDAADMPRATSTVSVDRVTLEDLFLRMTGDAPDAASGSR